MRDTAHRSARRTQPRIARVVLQLYSWLGAERPQSTSHPVLLGRDRKVQPGDTKPRVDNRVSRRRPSSRVRFAHRIGGRPRRAMCGGLFLRDLLCFLRFPLLASVASGSYPGGAKGLPGGVSRRSSRATLASYSYLSAKSGCTPAARRAGNQPATRPTRPSASAATPIVSGSAGEMPNSCARTS